jgi:uncharacterized integral membrane protein
MTILSPLGEVLLVAVVIGLVFHVRTLAHRVTDLEKRRRRNR